MPPKRKRNAEPTLQEKLENHHNDIAKALKASKGFERQRMSKRVHEAGITPDKQERLEREISVLKSIDLHQTALAHLYSSLLKVKSIAASTDLPDEIRAGVPKPELSEEERIALHNVTSGLYNRPLVKQAVEKAIAAVCNFLKVPVPGKAKRVRKKDLEKEGEQPADRISEETQEEHMTISVEEKGEEDDVTDFEGFESDLDHSEPAVGELDSEDEDEETAYSKLDNLLGSSSDEDEESEDPYARFRGTETVNLDDISLSGSGDGSLGAGSDLDESVSQSSGSASPPPKKAKKERNPAETGSGRDAVALPSLMGGYVSGSESASDIDVAAPKKRRGQRARQAIWEQKFGSKALHLKKQKTGRDVGWDMKRGAVDGDDQGRKTPWKKGVSNPFLRKSRDTQGGQEFSEKPRKPKVTKRDDEGKLHASWEAAKKAKEQKAASFSGSKIIFD